MDTEKDMRIKNRAYEIWENEGRPEGRDLEHWQKACRELDAEDNNTSGTDQDRPAGSPTTGGGLSSGLQSGGTMPGSSPAAGMGSIGTGGGSTAGRASGSTARKQRREP